MRNERNKAREEAKMLKDNLEHVLKENSNIKREKQNLEQQNECLRKELEKVNLILLKHAGIFLNINVQVYLVLNIIFYRTMGFSTG